MARFTQGAKVALGLSVLVYGSLGLTEIHGETTVHTAKPDSGSAVGADYRATMEQGIKARNQGKLDEAESLFRKAQVQSPSSVDPVFETAVTLEWRGEFEEAGELYGKLLEQNPALTSARLGLARVKRAQYRLEEAEAIYAALLKQDPKDAEARAGMAWIALANKQVGTARSGFQSILADEPSNHEAKAGLRQTEDAWRYQLDVVGVYIHNSNGSSVGGGMNLKVGLDAFNTLEIGNTYNGNELPSRQLSQQVFLPTTDTRLGYYYEVPKDFSLSLAYDYRYHEDLPDEHWIDAGGGVYLTKGLQWISGARVAFGDPQWNDLLLRTGLIADLTSSLRAGVTAYYDYADQARLPNNIRVDDSYSFAGDLYYETPGHLFLNPGVGFNPENDNLNLHIRAEIPVVSGQFFLTSLEYDSISDQFITNAGWRFRW